MAEGTVVEVAMFGLKQGVERGAFLVAVEETSAFLREETSGFRDRELLEGDDGRWFDVIHWASRAEAMAAAGAILESPRSRPFIEAIDPSSVTLLHVRPVHASRRRLPRRHPSSAISVSELTALKNIGDRSAARLAAVGITTAADLERIGPVGAWRLVERAYPRETSVVLLYALQGALLGLHWNDLPAVLRDGLVAEAALDGGPSRADDARGGGA